MDRLDALTALETAINAIDAESEADITLELTAAADAIGAAYVAVERAREEGFARTGRLSGRSTGRCRWGARKSVVWGKSVSVRVDLGGRRNDKKKQKKTK